MIGSPRASSLYRKTLSRAEGERLRCWRHREPIPVIDRTVWKGRLLKLSPEVHDVASKGRIVDRHADRRTVRMRTPPASASFRLDCPIGRRFRLPHPDDNERLIPNLSELIRVSTGQPDPCPVWSRTVNICEGWARPRVRTPLTKAPHQSRNREYSLPLLELTYLTRWATSRNPGSPLLIQPYTSRLSTQRPKDSNIRPKW